jgi:hypothetical protein
MIHSMMDRQAQMHIRVLCASVRITTLTSSIVPSSTKSTFDSPYTDIINQYNISIEQHNDFALGERLSEITGARLMVTITSLLS